MDERIITQARRAAQSALIMWFSGQWQRQTEQLDDLADDLIVWYLTRPSTRNKMETLSDPELMVTFRIQARQILSAETHESNVFDGKIFYSSDSVKDFLKGVSTNKYLVDIVPLAIDRIPPQYKEAILTRYTDGVVPTINREQQMLKEAVRSLTDEVNVICITTDVKTIGSKSVVFPDSVRPASGYSDPTANIALMLMEQHPSFVDEYLYESPWEQVCNGAEAEPIIEFGPSGRLRLSAEEADLFKRVPGLIDLFIDQRQKEWSGA